MKNLLIRLILLFSLGLLSGCQLVGDIFGAGVYTGIIIVMFFLVLILAVISKVFRRK